MAEQRNADLVALLNEWLAEDNGPDDADLEQQMRDLDAARHATQSLFWPTESVKESANG